MSLDSLTLFSEQRGEQPIQQVITLQNENKQYWEVSVKFGLKKEGSCCVGAFAPNQTKSIQNEALPTPCHQLLDVTGECSAG